MRSGLAVVLVVLAGLAGGTAWAGTEAGTPPGDAGVAGDAAVVAGDAGAVAAPACKPAGAVLFEIDELHDPEAPGLSTLVTKVYGNGAWTYAETVGEARPGIRPRAHAPIARAGCVTREAIAALRKAINGAPWKHVHYGMTCRGYSARYTVYKWRGAKLYTARMCSADGIDDKSSQALEDLRVNLDRATGNQLDLGGSELDPTVVD